MLRLRRILVATDFSRKASHAVGRAALLASEHGAAVHLIHAHRRLPADVLARLGIRNPEAERLEVALRSHLESEADALRGRGLEVSARMAKGGPLAAVRKALESFPADLVVVGTQDRRSLRNTLLGTTAQRLLEYVPRDVLAVSVAPRSEYERVIVCIASDRSAERVLSAAASLFPSARMHVVHAYEPLFEGKLKLAGASDAALSEHRKQSRREADQAVRNMLRRSTARHASLIVRRGYPPAVILDIARRRNAELIVMGRARTPVSELFLGSVSRQVLQEAGCDVAIVGRNPA